MAVENYLAAQGVLPDPFGSYFEGQMAPLRVQETRAQNALREQQAAALAMKAERDATFRSQIDKLDPADPAAISRMMAQFPEYAQELKGAFDVQDAETKRNNLLNASQIYGAAVAGDYTRAAKLARQRYEADLAAGQADEDDLAMVEALESEDPKQRQAALTQLGVALAAEVGPDKFAQTFGALNQQREGKVIGDYLIDPVTGEVRFQAPSKPEYKVIDGNLVEIPGTDGFSSGGGMGLTDQRGTPWEAHARPESIRQFDRLFEQIIQQESGGQQFGSDGKPLKSSKGAIGIAQVMPATAPEAAQLAGLPWNPGKYRNDPAYNLALGKAYFEKQLSDFGDPALAAAAYNAGPGRVKAAVKKGGDNWINHVPEETRQYVSNVVGAPRASGAPRVLYSAPPKQPDAPSGYRWTADGNLEPIQGGPAAKPEDAEKKRLQLIRSEGVAQNVIGKVGEARKILDKAILPATGFGSGYLQETRGTAAADLAATLETIKANLGFAELQAMREASPTGGALGQVAVQELNALQATVASLSQSQSEEQLRQNLDQIEKHYNRWLSVMRGENPDQNNANGLPVGWSVRKKR